ncbi:MAG: DUF1844 domain-containing protein [Proteobacteria bacterium]|nr:DUF1844 domain-containing protein [Pseudomonadota bacterium]MBU1232060.1 DUF1844 domain-containing protein [Pseudomonadota bacterium]MBU1420430.1 DUF1844 domain-containing protein [Pseudomonadota bacterium]MBU1456367.1 DUF1844 domain-containing protein [Pseudomonadota bacterium]
MATEFEQGCPCGDGKVPDRHGRCVMPEVTFTAFIMSLNTSALYHLGEIADPATGKKIIDFSLARHAIDTLVLLQEKTKGNLDSDEAEMLKNILYDVKMRFVQAVQNNSTTKKSP